MPNIFGGNAGRVIAVISEDSGYTPLGFELGDFKTQLGAKGLFTGMSGSGQSGVQIMHSLRQYIHIYTFGERIGEVTISGLTFMRDCTTDATSGFARFYDWYEVNRVSTLGGPLLMTLTTGLVMKGFLTGMRYQIEDPSISLIQFNLSVFHPPRVGKTLYSFSSANIVGTVNLPGTFTPSSTLGTGA